MRMHVLMVIAVLSTTACAAEESEPAPEVAATTQEEPQVAPPPAALTAWAEEEFGEDGYAEMKFATFDLNGDGSDEVLAYVVGPALCGSGGCSLYIFEQDAGALVERGNLTVTQLPVGVGEGNEQGWRDLVVTVSGGGIEGGLRKVPWTGDGYHSNPTVPPAMPVDSMETQLLSWD